jgi:hypothetical protein
LRKVIVPGPGSHCCAQSYQEDEQTNPALPPVGAVESVSTSFAGDSSSCNVIPVVSAEMPTKLGSLWRVRISGGVLTTVNV